jgi:hypothetical protein
METQRAQEGTKLQNQCFRESRHICSNEGTSLESGGAVVLGRDDVTAALAGAAAVKRSTAQHT